MRFTPLDTSIDYGIVYELKELSNPGPVRRVKSWEAQKSEDHNMEDINSLAENQRQESDSLRPSALADSSPFLNQPSFELKELAVHTSEAADPTVHQTHPHDSLVKCSTPQFAETCLKQQLNLSFSEQVSNSDGGLEGQELIQETVQQHSFNEKEMVNVMRYLLGLQLRPQWWDKPEHGETLLPTLQAMQRSSLKAFHSFKEQVQTTKPNFELIERLKGEEKGKDSNEVNRLAQDHDLKSLDISFLTQWLQQLEMIRMNPPVFPDFTSLNNFAEVLRSFYHVLVQTLEVVYGEKVKGILLEDLEKLVDRIQTRKSASPSSSNIAHHEASSDVITKQSNGSIISSPLSMIPTYNPRASPLSQGVSNNNPSILTNQNEEERQSLGVNNSLKEDLQSLTPNQKTSGMENVSKAQPDAELPQGDRMVTATIKDWMKRVFYWKISAELMKPEVRYETDIYKVNGQMLKNFLVHLTASSDLVFETAELDRREYETFRVEVMKEIAEEAKGLGGAKGDEDAEYDKGNDVNTWITQYNQMMKSFLPLSKDPNLVRRRTYLVTALMDLIQDAGKTFMDANRYKRFYTFNKMMLKRTRDEHVRQRGPTPVPSASHTRRPKIPQSSAAAAPHTSPQSHFQPVPQSESTLNFAGPPSSQNLAPPPSSPTGAPSSQNLAPPSAPPSSPSRATSSQTFDQPPPRSSPGASQTFDLPPLAAAPDNFNPPPHIHLQLVPTLEAELLYPPNDSDYNISTEIDRLKSSMLCGKLGTTCGYTHRGFAVPAPMAPESRANLQMYLEWFLSELRRLQVEALITILGRRRFHHLKDSTREKLEFLLVVYYRFAANQVHHCEPTCTSNQPATSCCFIKKFGDLLMEQDPVAKHSKTMENYLRDIVQIFTTNESKTIARRLPDPLAKRLNDFMREHKVVDAVPRRELIDQLAPLLGFSPRRLWNFIRGSKIPESRKVTALPARPVTPPAPARHIWPDKARLILSNWLGQHFEYPFPISKERKKLSELASVSEETVSIFLNCHRQSAPKFNCLDFDAGLHALMNAHGGGIEYGDRYAKVGEDIDSFGRASRAPRPAPQYSVGGGPASAIASVGVSDPGASLPAHQPTASGGRDVAPPIHQSASAGVAAGASTTTVHQADALGGVAAVAFPPADGFGDLSISDYDLDFGMLVNDKMPVFHGLGTAHPDQQPLINLLPENQPIDQPAHEANLITGARRIVSDREDLLLDTQGGGGDSSGPGGRVESLENVISETVKKGNMNPVEGNAVLFDSGGEKGGGISQRTSVPTVGEEAGNPSLAVKEEKKEKTGDANYVVPPPEPDPLIPRFSLDSASLRNIQPLDHPLIDATARARLLSKWIDHKPSYRAVDYWHYFYRAGDMVEVLTSESFWEKFRRVVEHQLTKLIGAYVAFVLGKRFHCYEECVVTQDAGPCCYNERFAYIEHVRGENQRLSASFLRFDSEVYRMLSKCVNGITDRIMPLGLPYFAGTHLEKWMFYNIMHQKIPKRPESLVLTEELYEALERNYGAQRRQVDEFKVEWIFRVWKAGKAYQQRVQEHRAEQYLDQWFEDNRDRPYIESCFEVEEHLTATGLTYKQFLTMVRLRRKREKYRVIGSYKRGVSTRYKYGPPLRDEAPPSYQWAYPKYLQAQAEAQADAQAQAQAQPQIQDQDSADVIDAATAQQSQGPGSSWDAVVKDIDGAVEGSWGSVLKDIDGDNGSRSEGSWGSVMKDIHGADQASENGEGSWDSVMKDIDAADDG